MTTPHHSRLIRIVRMMGSRDEENYVYKSGKGLNEGVVRELSGMKGEPEWMLKRRLQALEIFRKKPVPLVGAWANDKLAELDYDNIHYYRARWREAADRLGCCAGRDQEHL